MTLQIIDVASRTTTEKLRDKLPADQIGDLAYITPRMVGQPFALKLGPSYEVSRDMQGRPPSDVGPQSTQYGRQGVTATLATALRRFMNNCAMKNSASARQMM